MAVTFAISTAATTNASTYATGSFTPAAGDLLVVLVCATGTTLAGTCTESLGETTFTKVTTALKAASADTLYAFVSNQPLTTAGARTVSFGTAGGNASGAVVTVYRVSGQSRFGLGAVRQSAIQSNQAAAGTPAPTFGAAVLTGNPTLGIVGNATNAATMTPPTSWTEDSDNGYATPTTGQESVSRASGFTGTTVTWGSTSASAFGDIVVEIDTSTLATDDEDTSSWGGSFLPRVITRTVGALALSAAIFSAGIAAKIADQPQDEETVALAAYSSSYPQTFTRKLSGPGYSVRYAPDGGDDYPIAPSVTPLDEDFWQNEVLPVPATAFRSPLFVDRDEVPAGSLFGQYDEDFWRNPVAPVAAALYHSPVALDPDEIPGNLYGQPEEDFWQNPVRPVPASLFQLLPYSFEAVEIVPQPASPIQDEDFWLNPVFPAQPPLYRSPLFSDLEDVPAGSLFGQPDEDFWRNAVAPIPATNLWPQQWSFDVQEPAGSLSGQPDEDFWRNPVAPTQANLYQRLPLGDPEELPAGSLFGQADEDFWINQVRPVPAVQYRSPILGDSEELPAGALLSGQPDEDFWRNPVAPLPASLFQCFPYLFDSVDFVAAVQPLQDEDFWINEVPPGQSILYRSPLFVDLEEIPAGSLLKSASVEEYYWQNPVPPVAACLYRSPLFRDLEEVPAGALLESPAVDEYYWQNPAAPAQAVLYQRLPYGFDAGEIAFAPTVAPDSTGGGSLPARRRGRTKPHGAVPQLPAASVSAFAQPLGLSLVVELGIPKVHGAARAEVRSMAPVLIEAATPKAKGIRNPTDEELIAILLAI